MLSTARHVPVMKSDVLSLLRQFKCKDVLDCTFGSGGYSKEFLAHLQTVTSVHAIDRDPKALEQAELLQATYPGRFSFSKGSFAELRSLVADELQFDAVIFDLGLSTDQLLDAQRGFSFRLDGPLDMRINQSENIQTAADILNWASRERLENILRRFGDEPHFSAIADAIVSHRRKKIITSSVELAKLITDAIAKPFPGKFRGIHPATRAFQALRMAVNDELLHIEQGLKAAFHRLRLEGLLIAVCFHAIEDKMVKAFVNNLVESGKGRFINEKCLYPSSSEVLENPSARSAKLRAVIKISAQN